MGARHSWSPSRPPATSVLPLGQMESCFKIDRRDLLPFLISRLTGDGTHHRAKGFDVGRRTRPRGLPPSPRIHETSDWRFVGLLSREARWPGQKKLIDMKKKETIHAHGHSGRPHGTLIASIVLSISILIGLATSASAAPNQTVPFFQVKVTSGEVISSEVIPPSADYPLGAIKQVALGGGVATHEGRHVALFENILSAHPVEGGVIVVLESFVTVTVANGDELWWESLTMTPTPGTGEPPFYMEGEAVLVGGTGRFEGGTGVLQVKGTVTSEGIAGYEAEGSISSVGSNRQQ